MNLRLGNDKTRALLWSGEDIFTEKEEIAFFVEEIERERNETRNKKSRAQVS